MRIVYTLLVGLVLLQGVASAEDPEVQVVDGKVTISAQSVPLGQLLTLLDRAMGLTSQVKPELANRTVSVRFSDLELRDAVQKIFEGQPLNYMLIEGKGIRVTDLALSNASTSSTPTVSSFPDPSPVTPLAPPGPIQPALAQPVNTANQQPPVANTPFGRPSPNPNTPAGPTAAAPAATPGVIAPGQLPPPIGANNPLISPTVDGVPVGLPVTPAPPAQPTGPGTLGNVTPGVAPR